MLKEARFRFPIAIGFIAQRRSIDSAAEKARRWAVGSFSYAESIDYAKMCLREFIRVSEEKKLDRAR